MVVARQPSHQSKGLLGWLGRQVGYVKTAIQTDVEQLPKVVYRAHDVQQQPHPEHPNVMLRRTTIDEVIVAKQLPPAPPRADEAQQSQRTQ